MFNNNLIMTKGVANTIGGELLINIMQAVTKEKLWFIDDGDHSTLLYPDEY